jgi:hypothetical protein
MTMKQRIFLMVCATIISLGVLLFGYWTFYPYQVIKYPPGLIPMVNKKVKLGEPIRWYVDLEQLTQGVRVDIVRQLQDGIVINYPDTSYITTKGHMKFIQSTMIIPKYVPPGVYHVTIDSIYHINPIRTITIHRQTEDFEVIQ